MSSRRRGRWPTGSEWLAAATGRRRRSAVPARKRRIRDDKGIVRLVEALTRAKIECTLVLPWKQEIHVGRENSTTICRLVLKNERVLRRPLTELSLGRAYVE